MTKKRRSCLWIFSAHITTNVIDIEVSAPLGSRAMIMTREYFRFPEPKHPSTSFRLGQPNRVLMEEQQRGIITDYSLSQSSE